MRLSHEETFSSDSGRIAPSLSPLLGERLRKQVELRLGTDLHHAACAQAKLAQVLLSFIFKLVQLWGHRFKAVRAVSALPNGLLVHIVKVEVAF